jgi:DNA-directed RNA polymerase subunit delta
VIDREGTAGCVPPFAFPSTIQEGAMGGHQVPGMGTGDDGYDEEGYDESQRAEILEATRDGPTDGVVLTDLNPDLGDGDSEDEALDDIDMDAEEVGETDGDAERDESDDDEDDAQEDFDDDKVDDETLSDRDDDALRP